MAQEKPVAKGKPVPKVKAETGPIFGKRNYILFAIGMVAIIVGYIFLGTGDTIISPILLVLGYCVIIPIAIIIKDKKKAPESPSGSMPAEKASQPGK